MTILAIFPYTKLLNFLLLHFYFTYFLFFMNFCFLFLEKAFFLGDR